MSNRRKPPLMDLYRSEFLRSPAWFARRNRWFAQQAARGIPLECAACGRSAAKLELELHHLDYAGVVCERGRWKALERHDDLTAMHPYCHELLHRLLDRDAVLAQHRTRRVASHQALERLRRKLHQAEGGAQ